MDRILAYEAGDVRSSRTGTANKRSLFMMICGLPTAAVNRCNLCGKLFTVKAEKGSVLYLCPTVCNECENKDKLAYRIRRVGRAVMQQVANLWSSGS